MNYLKLSWIKRETFMRSTLIAIPNLNSLLELNDEFSADEVFASIVRLALKEFEKYFPYCLLQKVYITPDVSGCFDFIDNFEAYIQGKISEDQINLIPTTVMGFSTNHYTNFSEVIRQFRYPHPPRLTDFPFSAGIYYVRTLVNRPLYEEYTEESNRRKFSDKAGLYYTVNKGPEWAILFDEIYLQLCRYLIEMKKNMTMPNLPIELFQGLEEDYGKLEASQSQIYQQNVGNGNTFV